ncbi:MAG: M20 family metallopeptidase [Clostridiales bacterium]|uniref:M20 metallopeptidase family protein n=1 Tax=Terrisporobacter sp. TaxID=1965305 RepID=UPI002A5867F8|nr:M20 family metallopeptidase [Terrisporobacter sp.]MDD7753247.1 M20 family metallopeptidase [Clostridiales bacterium]MDY4134400.1 M20 family metallopeptidase [Terrisporobacter sp.]
MEHSREISNELVKEVIKIRRYLHKYPEISEKEYNTCKYIRNYLNNIGIKNNVVGETGAVGTLIKDKDLPTVAIRAEIDALPINEENTFEYKSKNNGVMHACGHDGITAVVLGLAKLLSENKDKLNCNVKFIFEPAEEVGKGAKKLIEEKVLEDPKVDNMIIFHFANSDTIGMEIQKHISTATIGRVSINILGKSSHWGDAKEGIDAISISGKVLNIIDKMNNSLKDKGPFILGIGMINGGVKNNIMADSVRLEGTLRAVGDDKFNYLLNYLEEKTKILSEESKATIEVNLESKLPSVVNDYNLVQIGRKIGEDIFKERFVLGEKVYLAGDNAAYYFQKTPGIRMVFFAKKENEINYPLHNSKFDFNEDIFYYALSTIYQMILSIR